MDLLLVSDENKAILLSSSMIPEKSTRTSQGVQLFNLKKRHTVQYVTADPEKFTGPRSYRKLKIPATGVPMDGFDPSQQVKLL